MAISNKAYFLDGIKNNPMTINEIVAAFGCNANTARTWVKGDDVEKVLGSYPPAYVRKDTFIIESPIKAPDRKAPDNKVTVQFDRPPQEEVEAFFAKVMSGEGGNIDFQTEFRSVDSQKSLMLLQNKLKSAFILTEYYKALMIKDGID